MASSSSSKQPDGVTSGTLGSPISFRNRRGSVGLMSGSSITDKEELANALDHIHTTARESDHLTTFNDFAEPPISTSAVDNKGTAGDLVQQGFSGLYSRFREAVGAGSAVKRSQDADDGSIIEKLSRKSMAEGHSSRPSISSLSRVDTATTLDSVLHAGSTGVVSPAAYDEQADQGHAPQSSKTSVISLMTGSKSQAASRQSLPTNAMSSVNAVPSMSLQEDPSRVSLRTQDSADSSSRRRLSRPDSQARCLMGDTPSLYDVAEGVLSPRSKSSSLEGSVDTAISPIKGSAPPLPPIQTRHIRNPSAGSSLLSPDFGRKRPTAIDRLSRSRSPGRIGSRDSSPDRGMAAATPVNMSAHSSVYHESFAQDSRAQHRRSGDLRIPGTTMEHQGATDQIAQLDRMRRQVLSKEFWMKDDTVKECFLCQTPFTAFRRKHHCRTCGCIFDSKCTTIISGSKFGVQGNLKVCKICLDVISRRFDASGSEDSGDEHSFMPRFFGNHSKSPSTPGRAKGREQDVTLGSEGIEDARPVSSPMMAIPTRRVKDSNNRSSAVLEIDSPQLSRPGSSRSLRSMGSGRPQSSAGHGHGLGHKRHHSKHSLLGRYNQAPKERAPFRKAPDSESSKKPKFPAFHDDNIIDPELADYMSDESSEEEQMSIFATMATTDLQPGSFENDRSNFSHLANAGKRHRHRAGEKSISGISFASRGALDDPNGPASLGGHRRPNRRRNVSNVGGPTHHLSPRPKSAVLKGPQSSSEMVFSLEHQHGGGSLLVRSDSLQQRKTIKAELNKSSVLHVHKLLYQLLADAMIPDPSAWQKALVPILLQSTDDVDPDVVRGEDMDIRHYVKLKRIPGGKPGDTAYVSGVVFTKNLALKSMPRRITNPRIVLVTFPVEYQRHQQHFMSLQPVIEQEKEFLRVVVQRITNLRPQLLLAEKNVSGVALQYLSDANIAVAYNVKHTVIEAVARCAETEIVTSLDMLALPVKVGRCSNFEVRTFVNHDYPGRKKSYIFLSGCKPELGCTIALRGSTNATLAKIKHIVEFMVYVVYNLKLESSLLRDEAIEPPEGGEGSMSSSMNANDGNAKPVVADQAVNDNEDGPTMVFNQPESESERPSQLTAETSSLGDADGHSAADPSQTGHEEAQSVISMEKKPDEVEEVQVPDDVPMPTFYSDMVAKYDTRTLSASPYVKFSQPYLLMKAREQERRLLYLRQLKDHDSMEQKEDAEETENREPQKFQLIQPEMVEELGPKAPKQIREILHAVHDAEYDKAFFNYQTQTKQWETYMQGSIDLFDPYSHQNIVVLYSVICIETKIPCNEPVLVAINFYDEQHVDTDMDPDCTLGQYIEDLVYSKDDTCNSNGCERKMLEHHRTYVHDQSRITVCVEHVPNAPARQPELGDGITMWTYCKPCKKDSSERAMSGSTFKYSFGKYLELLYWGRGLRMKDSLECPHDHQRDHVRYFSLEDSRIRIHCDPIDLLEIIVPRATITWKVANDLRLKNEIFTRMQSRWDKFMTSVKARLGSIRIDSVLPEKTEACKAELDQLTKKANEDQPAVVRRLQDIYVKSKYYEVVPFNVLVHEMLEKAGEWDTAFTKFEADFLGDKDMRQLTMMQLKKMFTDNESRDSVASNEGSGSITDSDERPSQTYSEADEKSSQPTESTVPTSMESSETSGGKPDEGNQQDPQSEKVSVPMEDAIQRVEALDLAGSPVAIKAPGGLPQPTSGQDVTQVPSLSPSHDSSLPAPPSAEDESSTGVSESQASASGNNDIGQVNDTASGHTSMSNSTTSAIPGPKQSTERRGSRKSISNSSIPMIRAASQPARPLQRSRSSVAMRAGLGESKVGEAEGKQTPEQPTSPVPEGSIKVEKKLSERLGLSALKSRTRSGQSGIPRLVSKKRETKVSTLARHFEQLSREFEKERIRDRKQRAATMKQPRAMLQRTTTKAIIEVYDNVNEAFEEPAHGGDHPSEQDPSQQSAEAVPKQTEDAPQGEPPVSSVPVSPKTAPADKVAKGQDEDASEAHTTSQTLSDDEGLISDAETPVSEEFLPDIKEIADSLEPSAEIPLELPKHQKTSLMKYLTNFWAERSASGWPPLEYPVSATEHIFVDSDIIVREDEPSSVIALALDSDDYQNKLAGIRREAHAVIQKEADGAVVSNVGSMPSESADWTLDETELEKSLLRVTGTHLRYQFKDGASVMTCKIFYAEQFDALRRKCGVAERIVESLSRCLKWDSKGGKTKSVFLKTLDDRLILKSLSPIETSAFLRFAPGYFNIMAECLFHDLPSVIAKMLGFFQVFIKNPQTGTDVKLDLLITENLFYDRSPSRIFDLKGSMRNRKIQSTGEQNEVLLDENMVEYIYESPLFAREHSKKLLRWSVWNDTLFLARQNVMDYSLMIAVDEAKKELVVGIIDCIRTYTWDKKLESWIKDRGFVGGGRNRPTVTSPKEYKSRFREAMARYILQSPTCWHLFSTHQFPHGPQKARFEEPEELKK